MQETTGNEESKQTSRREFLRNATLLGVGASLLPVSGLHATETVNATELPEKATEIKPVKFTILYTADIHAQLNTHDEFFWENEKAVYKKRGGLAVLKTMIQKHRQPNTILIDGGDFFHGHGVASLTEGKALIPIFNNMGYDLMLPGNWEVVYKKKMMLYDMGHTNAAKICANMFHDFSDENKGDLIYPPYWIKVVDGVKIGFIGYTDHLIPKRQSPAYSKGIRFEHADKSVARYVKMLREYEGCAVVFLVTHMGLAQQVALGNNPVTKGVDFILGADTHERVRQPIQCQYTKVVECGAFGSFLGKLEVELESGQMKSYHYQLLDVDSAAHIPDAELQTMIDAAIAPFKNELKQVVGHTSTSLVRYFVIETPMDNLLTDAIMWKFKPDVALSNGFRFCQPLAVEGNKTEITKEFLWNMLPVNSEAKTAMVTGRQIWDWLEKELENAFAKDTSHRLGGWFVRFAGMEVNFTVKNDFGKRVNKVTIKGQPMDMIKEYSIVACEREGDPDDTLCRMERVKSPRKLGVLMHAVIEEYLTAHPLVAPKIEGRSTATDFPPTLLTQLQGTTYEFR